MLSLLLFSFFFFPSFSLTLSICFSLLVQCVCFKCLRFCAISFGVINIFKFLFDDFVAAKYSQRRTRQIFWDGKRCQAPFVSLSFSLFLSLSLSFSIFFCFLYSFLFCFSTAWRKIVDVDSDAHRLFFSRLLVHYDWHFHATHQEYTRVRVINVSLRPNNKLSHVWMYVYQL